MRRYLETDCQLGIVRRTAVAYESRHDGVICVREQFYVSQRLFTSSVAGRLVDVVIVAGA
jgi:hypothetical protein